jgi:hypothetical protein
MVKGPGIVALIARSVCARRNASSPTPTACLRRIGPTTRGTEFGSPRREIAVPGWSRSTPSSAVAKRFE